MDTDVGGQHNIRHSTNSSSSAVDVFGTGLGISVPPSSPTLTPSDTSSRGYTRRRLSWSNAEGRGQDSPRLDLPLASQRGPSSPAVLRVEDDPFFSPVEHASRKNSFHGFSTSHPGVSFTSFQSTSDSDADPVQDDDEMRLASKPQRTRDGRTAWSSQLAVDSERSAGLTPRRRRRYTTLSASPLERTGTVIQKAFRRASMRVANVRGHRQSARLQNDSEDSDSTLDGVERTTERDAGEWVTHETQPGTPLRGWVLGFLGPTNPLRVRLYHLLIHPYTEPTILALIVVNAVALVVQASRTLLLPPSQAPVTATGYFHAWEDFILFTLFIVFTYVIHSVR
ncbi:hypothetical protein JVU11DRAFT_7076 [Chiua virens]|nr:hypothetical protein JVU11DRAFT_7076 [Chiua virens]